MLFAPRVVFRVHAADQVALAFVLDPWIGRRVEQRATDDDDAAGKEAGARLEGHAADLECSVAAHAPSAVHGEGCAERCLVDALVVARGSLVDLAGALAHQRCVRRDVVMLGQEGEQTHLHVVQAARRADVIEAALP